MRRELRTAQGGFSTCCSVDSAASPLSGCAARHAVAAPVPTEGPSLQIAEPRVLALDPQRALQEAARCGGWRPQIFEFGAATRVHFRSAGQRHSAWRRQCAAIRPLPPFGFGFGRRFESR